MSDRELLELAAKAAGIRLLDWLPRINQGLGAFLMPETGFWNPLTDDGDALRLAVKLYLFDAVSFMGFRSEETWANPDRDDYEITRRAIVRAAAEIGRGL